MPESYWERRDWSRLASERPDILSLAQGDLLPGCLVPVVPQDFGPESTDIGAAEADLIIVTQSCDLANEKVSFAALCPVYRLDAFEEADPALRAKGRWEEVRRGRREGIHMLGGTFDPADNRDAMVVDFRQIYSLPAGYLRRHAAELDVRHRFRSPFLEHFSQAFARFFMRVGLPSSIPPFK